MRRAIVSLVVLVAAGVVASASSVSVEDRIRAAVVAAVHERMGAGAEVVVDDVRVFSAAGVDPSDVTPVPNAQLGPQVNFVLHGQSDADGRRRATAAGRAVVVMRVSAPHVSALRLIPRGKTIAAEDIVEETGEVSHVPLRRLPVASDVIGGRALHDIAAGALLAGSAVAMPGAVKSGQPVRAVALVGGVEVAATLVSMQTGQVGDIIRVVNKDSRRELRARVIGEGSVEVIQ
jgi:flagella basal body P-ring formation protein FlgA